MGRTEESWCKSLYSVHVYSVLYRVHLYCHATATDQHERRPHMTMYGVRSTLQIFCRLPIELTTLYRALHLFHWCAFADSLVYSVLRAPPMRLSLSLTAAMHDVWPIVGEERSGDLI